MAKRENRFKSNVIDVKELFYNGDIISSLDIKPLDEADSLTSLRGDIKIIITPELLDKLGSYTVKTLDSSLITKYVINSLTTVKVDNESKEMGVEIEMETPRDFIVVKPDDNFTRVELDIWLENN